MTCDVVNNCPERTNPFQQDSNGDGVGDACEEYFLFRRGDCNDDGGVDIADPIYVLNHLFGGSLAPSCIQTADTNDDNVVNIADPIYQLNHLFGGGPALPAPVGECGTDPTPAANPDDNLSCEAYPPCDA